MKAKDVKTWEDFEKYLKQCGARYEHLDTNIGVHRFRVKSKIISSKGIDVTFDEIDNTCHALMHWLSSLKDFDAHLITRRFTDLEQICKICWRFSRRSKRLTRERHKIMKEFSEELRKWREV